MIRFPIVALLTMLGAACDHPRTSSRGEHSVVADDSIGHAYAELHPTPEERLATARTLPDCAIHAVPAPLASGWRWQRVRPIAAELPMSAEMHDEPDQVPEDPQVQQWGREGWGDIELMLDTHAQQSTGFAIWTAAGMGSTEPACSLKIGPYLSLVRRSAFAHKNRRGSEGTDSSFVAYTDIPFALPDSQLGIGINANTRAGRDTLLSMLAALRFIGESRQH